MDIFERAKDFEPEGIPWTHRLLRAELEERVKAWPEAWGDDLLVTVYGDFRGPTKDLEFGSLGIVIEAAENKKRLTFGGSCARVGRVAVRDKSVASVTDGFRRLNQLLGILSAADYGIGIRWWCHFFDSIGGVIGNLESETVPTLLLRWELSRDEVRTRLDAAMFWIREARTLTGEQGREHFTAYAHYWNALECLVYASEELAPRARAPRDERRARIREEIQRATDDELFETLRTLYQSTVNPTFRMRAEAAWETLVPSEATAFAVECFEHRHGLPSLYSIRNQINHGSIDIGDPETLFMITGRIGELQKVVWTMFWHVLNAAFFDGLAHRGLAPLKQPPESTSEPPTP